MGALVMQLFVAVAAVTSFRLVEVERVHLMFEGSLLATGGYMTCEQGWSEITLATLAPEIEATLAHELAHAVDCQDDGQLNGSPLPPGAILARPIPHCLANPAEFYACWTVERGDASSMVAVLAEPASISLAAPGD